MGKYMYVVDKCGNDSHRGSIDANVITNRLRKPQKLSQWGYEKSDD